MSASTIVEKVALLAAQCPAPPSAPENAASLPIHVERVGSDGPTIIFVHGGVQTGAGGGPLSFAKQRVLAERGWQLGFVDRPGFGKSPSRGVDDMMADAVWVGDMLGEGAHLVGHSWGGAEAFLAAARRPEAVRSLILIEPALHVLALSHPETDAASRAAIGGLLEPLLTAQTPADYGRGFIHTAGVVGSSTFDAGNADDNAGTVDDAMAERFGCALLQARMAPPPALQHAAQAVAAAKIPTLIITGGWNPAFDAIGQVVARLTNGRFATVRAPNHFPQMENPEALNDLLDAFAREAEAVTR